MAVLKVGRDDLLLGAIWELFVPGDLHHLLPLLLLVMAGEPGLGVSQGAHVGEGFTRLHEITQNTRC